MLTPNAALPHLLAVDDDSDVTELIASYFGAHGFRVSAAHSAEQMRALLARDKVDLVLLDLGLPDADGVALARNLREHWQGAVIIVSGRGETVDRIVGLEVGADDYVSKPFDLRELLARAKSVLRRAGEATVTNPRSVLVFDGWCLDAQARILTNPSGAEVALTTGEFELLNVLAHNPQRVLTRDQIMDRIHYRASGPYDRAIDVQIGRLRRKIEGNVKEPRLIKSVRGAGYLFACDVKRESR
ncbi:MAG: response regulator transcription factor [Betaproteobacteria bacterium]|nr:response regulator transcription factor [Betaproteobacteria bacterium]